MAATNDNLSHARRANQQGSRDDPFWQIVQLCKLSRVELEKVDLAVVNLSCAIGLPHAERMVLRGIPWLGVWH